MSNWQAVGPMELYMTDRNNNVTRKQSSQTNIYCVAVATNNDNLINLGTENRPVFKSIDKGETWTTVTNGLTNNNLRSKVIDPTNNTVYFRTTNALYKTIDAGLNWNGCNSIRNPN